MPLVNHPSAAMIGVIGLATASLLLHKLHSSTTSKKKKIVITAGCGNLGTKLATHLLAHHNSEYSIVLIEHPSYVRRNIVPKGVSDVVEIDLRSPSSFQQLRGTFRGADAVVHFSAVNPYPNASWDESAGSMDHSFHVMLAASSENVRRVVLASSNHVMGGYKDDDLVDRVTPSLPVNVGTQVETVEVSGDAKAYGAAKLAAERLCACLATSSGFSAVQRASTSFVVLRIGWCQPGANLPSTLSAAGSPPEFLSSPSTNGESTSTAASSGSGAMKDEAWFKGMWLSNRDFLAYMDAAIRLPNSTINERCRAAAQSDARPYQENFVIVNAMSNNSGMKWCLEHTKAVLGVTALDDSAK